MLVNRWFPPICAIVMALGPGWFGPCMQGGNWAATGPVLCSVGDAFQPCVLLNLASILSTCSVPGRAIALSSRYTKYSSGLHIWMLLGN